MRRGFDRWLKIIYTNWYWYQTHSYSIVATACDNIIKIYFESYLVNRDKEAVYFILYFFFLWNMKNKNSSWNAYIGN